MNIYDIKVHKSWDLFIKDSKELDKMLSFVEKTRNISPAKEKVFRFFENDVSKAKCIILGMDPYPSDVATGRAFEVRGITYFTDKYKQSSLSKIFKALWYYRYDEMLSMEDLREEAIGSKNELINIKTWYDEMEKQGVIFLNATLTTLLGKADAHTNIWEAFMDELLHYIVDTNGDIKWLIWGQNALMRVESIVPPSNIIYTCHPASRVNNTFVEDCTFRKVGGIKWF